MVFGQTPLVRSYGDESAYADHGRMNPGPPTRTDRLSSTQVDDRLQALQVRFQSSVAKICGTPFLVRTLVL